MKVRLTQEEWFKWFDEGNQMGGQEIDNLLADWQEERDEFLDYVATLEKIIYTLNGVNNLYRIAQQSVDVAIKSLIGNVMGGDVSNAGEITKDIIERLDPQYGEKK